MLDKEEQFKWTEFYNEFADVLLQYKNRRKELIGILEESYQEVGMKYPFMEHGKSLDDICPFTVMGSFNRGISDANRQKLMAVLGNKLGIKAEIPTKFDGIPTLDARKSWFFAYKEERGAEDISNLWTVFEKAIIYADHPDELKRQEFIIAYNKVIKQLCVRWNITMGLYWIRPYFYLNLDSKNTSFLLSKECIVAEKIEKVSKLKTVPLGKEYLELRDICKESFNIQGTTYHSFPELAYQAWIGTKESKESKEYAQSSFMKWFGPLIGALKALGGAAKPDVAREQIKKDLKLREEDLQETRGKRNVNKFDNEVAWARMYLAYEGIIDRKIRGVWTLTEKGKEIEMTEELASQIVKKWRNTSKQVDSREDDQEEKQTIHYWVYAAGENAHLWEEYYETGYMGIGWNAVGDIRQYPQKSDLTRALQQSYDEDSSFKMVSKALWDFTYEMKIGDVIYVKNGLRKIIGKGIVMSDYDFDEQRENQQHIRKVKWLCKGEWDYPGQAPMKTLTDMTSYMDLIHDIEASLTEDSIGSPGDEPTVHYEEYTKKQFLEEVFMEENTYETLVGLLKHKQNIILQGAPGVGKTFAAKRLAYAIMGEKDTSRVMMVQFHQSYSYEDFIMGYRPDKEGFKLAQGPFYEFCKRAEEDDENDYFFIIDEINRGNLSKIFGELLMLIENDKRGQKLRLLYANELFSVPKNVYIIGMMNTADRSLAMIDYALRRRFAFFEMAPAFETKGFENVMKIANHPKFNDLVECIKQLNLAISQDEVLGNGFRIGHSYLCTKEAVDDKWLEAVIKYELIPLINEYWFDEPAKVQQWTDKLCGVIK